MYLFNHSTVTVIVFNLWGGYCSTTRAKDLKTGNEYCEVIYKFYSRALYFTPGHKQFYKDMSILRPINHAASSQICEHGLLCQSCMKNEVKTLCFEKDVVSTIIPQLFAKILDIVHWGNADARKMFWKVTQYDFCWAIRYFKKLLLALCFLIISHPSASKYRDHLWLTLGYKLSCTLHATCIGLVGLRIWGFTNQHCQN